MSYVFRSAQRGLRPASIPSAEPLDRRVTRWGVALAACLREACLERSGAQADDGTMWPEVIAATLGWLWPLCAASHGTFVYHPPTAGQSVASRALARNEANTLRRPSAVRVPARAS
jgi:hypothetical protein